jgi:ubiquinone/menaquinone biosynthesis C-methylase UbiE
MDNNWKTWKKVEYFDEKDTTFHQNKLNLLFNLHKINSKNYSVLEVGSGHGRYTIIFQKLFKTILALDLESELIDLLNNKISEKSFNNISTIRSNFEDFNTKSKFDMILFTQSLLWITDKKKLF